MIDEELLRAARAVWDAIQKWPEDAADVVIERLSRGAFLEDHSEDIVRGLPATSLDIECRVADALSQMEDLLANS